MNRKPRVAKGDTLSLREESGDTSTVTVSELKIEVKSLADLVKVCKIDTNTWRIAEWKCKAYSGFMKDAESKPVAVTLYSVTANLKRIKGINFEAEIKSLCESIRAVAPEPLPVFKHTDDRRCLLELTIPDLHVGKLAWHKECGESYDAKIARYLFDSAIDTLLERTSGYVFEEVALVIGNDLLNSDNSENTTTKGTPQSTDGRHQKSFKLVQEMVRSAVEKCRLVAGVVRVVVVPGNHDKESMWFLGEVLDAYFCKYDDVVIDNAPTMRKYLQFGKVLLGFTHGSEEKKASLPLIMATEKPELWGQTLFREWHTGHLHKRGQTSFNGVDEHNGVVIRILPTLCGSEDWHVSKGYIGNIRCAEAYVWDADEGLLATHIYNVPPRPDLLAKAA